MTRSLFALSLLSLASCSSPAEFETENGAIYRLETAQGFKSNVLPSNNALKMADGKLDKFGAALCKLDLPGADAIQRCDVFYQSSADGKLRGYATLTYGTGVALSTDVVTNATLGVSRSCAIEGATDLGVPTGSADAKATQNFSGRIMYEARQNSPGNVLVSPVAADETDFGGPGTTLGVWYVERSNDKLRLSQERWNYCYDNSDVNVDEVFTRAFSMTRVAGPKEN